MPGEHHAVILTSASFLAFIKSVVFSQFSFRPKYFLGQSSKLDHKRKRRRRKTLVGIKICLSFSKQTVISASLFFLLLLFCNSSNRHGERASRISTNYWTCLVNLILMLCVHLVVCFDLRSMRRRVFDKNDMILRIFLFLFFSRRRRKNENRESNNRTVTHMDPDDDDDENSVTFPNRISSLISISNKMLWIMERLEQRT